MRQVVDVLRLSARPSMLPTGRSLSPHSIGRVEDALAVLQQCTPRPLELPDGPWQGDPPR
ncbi:hypothetical protein VR46_35255 [Streptomyces sp. NRRL S-444]|nr:hypothetical protein VR46_35255 [Streptomyces sp. NRRL S-444]